MRVYICCIAILLFTACQRQVEKPFVIGVSQCSDDAWRQRMNKELETELIFHPDLILHIRQAKASSAIQCAQIDSFIAEKIDLLIVSPNEAVEVQPAVARAYRAGIPVVIADRRVSGGEWTAFVGGDNQQVGRELGKWILNYPCGDKDSLRVLEVAGLRGSTPSVGRHGGMMETLAQDPKISVKTVSGRWFADPAFHAVDSVLITLYRPDVIVAQNDLMAIGAARACNRHGLKVPILGVDAIAGTGGGLEAILNGDITASALYPSRGDLVLKVAAQILHGEPYQRETHLATMLVDSEKAKAMQDMSELLADELGDIRQLQDRVQTLRSQHEMQRALTYMMVTLLILLLVVAVATYFIIRYRARIKKERAEHEELVRKQREQLEKITAELKQTKEHVPEEQRFMTQLTREIERALDSPDLGVDSLARTMGVSRTVLFRKTKNATGQSPIELIHHIRLHKANELLQKTDLTVQQVAYSVGFSTPGYFTKKYKEEFGCLPSSHTDSSKKVAQK